MTSRHHFFLGGQRSGKSRRAEQAAARWLDLPTHEAVLLATALGGDGEMAERIARHRADRAMRVPRLHTVEVPHALVDALAEHSAPHRLVVIDCLTLWLTNLLMPLDAQPLAGDALHAAVDALVDALQRVPGPVVLVSNEIGLGLSPMGREARHFVDELGRLHQAVAAVSSDVTLMVAGLELAVKRP